MRQAACNMRDARCNVQHAAHNLRMYPPACLPASAMQPAMQRSAACLVRPVPVHKRIYRDEQPRAPVLSDALNSSLGRLNAGNTSGDSDPFLPSAVASTAAPPAGSSGVSEGGSDDGTLSLSPGGSGALLAQVGAAARPSGAAQPWDIRHDNTPHHLTLERTARAAHPCTNDTQRAWRRGACRWRDAAIRQ